VHEKVGAFDLKNSFVLMINTQRYGSKYRPAMNNDRVQLKRTEVHSLNVRYY
jgi:hypothetical protein